MRVLGFDGGRHEAPPPGALGATHPPPLIWAWAIQALSEVGCAKLEPKLGDASPNRGAPARSGAQTRWTCWAAPPPALPPSPNLSLLQPPPPPPRAPLTPPSSSSAHPAPHRYASLKALQSPIASDDAQWLLYWVVYVFLSTAETLFFIAKYIPFYSTAKLVTLLWLVAPATQGADVIYRRVIQPLLKTYGARLDPVFAGAEKVITSRQIGALVALAESQGPAAARAALDKAVKETKALVSKAGARR